MCKRIQWKIWKNCQKKQKHGTLVVEDKCPKFRKGAKNTGADSWCPDFNRGKILVDGDLYDPYCPKCNNTWKEPSEKKPEKVPEQGHRAPQRAGSSSQPRTTVSDRPSSSRSNPRMRPPNNPTSSRPTSNPIFPRPSPDEDVEMRDYSDSEGSRTNPDRMSWRPQSGSDFDMDLDTPKDYRRWI
ncbi:hypothetical protein B0A52_04160 [Exophiala mesophila]|uniref:Uncharacterized protein n=1 Tax=Exophiala mesophila TaxID=212818 RepID=A0A438NAG9_EXOME|nr:hypothetical protein B0A52_04160 [Exophiala mesophila]